MLFGSAADDMIAAAIDFERCPVVSAMHLDVANGQITRGITMKRVREAAVTLQQREIPVFEVLVTRGNYESTMFVTKAAPHVVVKRIHSTPPGTSELVKLEK